jgi:hypothetical protein
MDDSGALSNLSIRFRRLDNRDISGLFWPELPWHHEQEHYESAEKNRTAPSAAF